MSRTADNRFLNAWCVVVLSAAAAGAVCPFSGDTWTRLSPSRQDSILSAAGPDFSDRPCFKEYLLARAGRMRASGISPGSVLSVVSRYMSEGNRLDTDLLFFLVRAGLAQENPRVFTEIATQWEREHGDMRQSSARLQEFGRLAEADSVLAIVEISRGLQAFDYLRWAQLKHVLGTDSAAASLLCRAARVDAGMGPVSRNHLLTMLTEADTQAIRSALAAYGECMLSSASTDALALRTWLADAYFRFGLHDEAAGVLTRAGQASSGPQLLAMARRLFADRVYAKSAVSGAAAWARLDDPRLKAVCATVVYQSYAALGRPDSALKWVNRTGLAGAGQLADAVVLYQTCGMLDKADSILSRLQPSVLRDTLRLRQHIFGGQWAEAVRTAGSFNSSGDWKPYRREARLWLMRTALFSGDAAAARAVLDSLTIDPTWPYAEEALFYRYAFGRLGGNAETLARWGRTERAIYVGIPRESLDAGRWDRYPESGTLLIAGRLARGLVDSRRYAEALTVLEALPDSCAQPEHRFLRGEALLKLGRVEEGRGVLQRLMVSCPQDVFSVKARVLLSGLDRT